MDTQLSVDNHIDDMIRECKIHRFASELQNTDNEERKQKIRDILQLLQGVDKSEIENNARNKLNKIYDNIDKTAFNKNWSRLTFSQRQDRIKDFFNKSIKDDIIKENLEKKILNMLENKKLKRTYIEYDNINGTIISINLPEKTKTTNTKIKKKSINSDSSDESSVYSE